MSDLIYLDHHATTPLDPLARTAMLTFLEGVAGNPSSPNPTGRRALSATLKARDQVATLVGARGSEVVWTSGATEANNLAVLGIDDLAGNRKQVISSRAEHPSVLEPLEALRRQGADVVLLEVDANGRISASELADAVSDRTALVSISAANGELGGLEPLADLAGITHRAGAVFHSDASQAAGRVPIDVAATGIDLLTISAHKMHGPQGVGALVARSSAKHLLRPRSYGGGQQSGLRPGTPNVPAIVGFGTAAAEALRTLHDDGRRVAALRDRLLHQLTDRIPDVDLNGTLKGRLPHNLNVRFVGVDADALIASTPGVAFSAGSACSEGSPEPSAVLLASGMPREAAEESVRFGLGRFTTDDDVDQAAGLLARTVARLRPLAAPATSGASR